MNTHQCAGSVNLQANVCTFNNSYVNNPLCNNNSQHPMFTLTSQPVKCVTYSRTQLVNINNRTRQPVSLKTLARLKSLGVSLSVSKEGSKSLPLYKVVKPSFKKRGKRGGKRKQRPIHVISLPRQTSYKPPRSVIRTNLIEIDLRLAIQDASNHLKVSFLNAQSARNKTVILRDFVVESNSDIVFITETWFSTVADSVLIEELTPPGFCIHSISRLTGKGGGLCVIIRSSITSSCSALRSYKSFEACELQMSTTDDAATFILLYRPPPNKKNKPSTNMFVSEFKDLLDSYTSNRGQFIILGDFNLHFNSTSGQYVQTIKTTLEC